MRVLLIEDNSDLADSITEQLVGHYSIDGASTAKSGLYLAQLTPYDLIILDLGLPDIHGTKLCTVLRTEEITTPILVLTAEFELDAKVEALDAGADDYLTKPFQFAELEARMRCLIRRGPCLISGVCLTFRDLTLNTAARTLSCKDEHIYLKRKEFDILEVFLRNPGLVVSRGMLLEHVWNGDVNELTNSIDVHVGRLRKRLHQILGVNVIQTIYGFGYRLDDSPSINIDHLILSEEVI